MKTYMANAQNVERNWYVIDATGQTLGRLAAEIAKRLQGKHKPTYTPHVDTGDYIVVINAGDVKVTGRKREMKMYYRHSGYPGGLYEMTLEQMLQKHPTRVLGLAVKRMLPRGPLGRAMLRKLKIYAGATHPHEAQQPEALFEEK